jgi:tetratricopeptide (TPR) repeat protein
MKIRLSILLAVVCAGKLLAADAVGGFAAANKLYAEGNFSGAATAYETILQNDGQSAALWFNCGNSEFKAGRLGKAIAAYRHAELLAPRDAELHANLAFVRNQVQGASLRESQWQKWVGSLSLNEGTVLTALFFWGMCGLFIIRQIRPALVPRLRTVTRLMVALTAFSGGVLVLQAADHFNSAVAVVTAPDATARSGPWDDAQVVFNSRDGAELKVLDRHDDWVQVADATGKIGWLNKKQAEALPGA